MSWSFQTLSSTQGAGSVDCADFSFAIALNLEGLTLPVKPYPVFDFADKETMTTLKTMTDKSVGGFSTANLAQMARDPTNDPPSPAHILFTGNISTKLPTNRPDIARTGYAAWRNQDRGMTLFGELFWNVDSYMYLALRVKSDGRKYFVNIQTDSIVESDIHQHRLYTKFHKGAEGPDSPAQWETVWIRFTRVCPDKSRDCHGATIRNVTAEGEELRNRFDRQTAGTF